MENFLSHLHYLYLTKNPIVYFSIDKNKRMEFKPFISHIAIYPVKSLDGISLRKTEIAEGGCLLHDREYAIFDTEGNLINGKSNPSVHTLRSTVDFEKEIISFQRMNENKWCHFHLEKERMAVQHYLSQFFGAEVELKQNKTGGFLDIPEISGITLLSTASLQSVSEWFGGMDLNETRKRFRATVEIDGVPAFWEDHLFSNKGSAIEFQCGKVRMIGISPRERCVVPTRHPETGEVLHGFPKIFAKDRLTDLPGWSFLKQYGHSYYLSVDCFIPATEIGKFICVGDELKISGVINAAE